MDGGAAGAGEAGVGPAGDGRVDPFVRVVVLNWNSAWFTRRCLDALALTEYPSDRLEVVLVDNGSVDGSLPRLRRWFPDLVVVENGRNLGFAEGCNRAMRDRDGVDAIALVNNDAVVDPGWLRALVDALESDDRIGAVSARLVLEPAFLAVDVHAEGTVSVERVCTDGAEVTGAVRFDGFDAVSDAAWPLDVVQRLHRGDGRLWVPAAPGVGEVQVDLRGSGRIRVDHGDRSVVAASPGDVVVRADEGRTRLLNGIGTARNARCEGFDRHYGVPVDSVADEQQQVVDVEGVCGGAALLRSEMLDEVGLFDPRLFAYYEDTDLSWRASRAGWRVVAAPGAVVEHAFGASGGSRAPGFFHLDRRNWWLTAERNGTPEQRATVRAEVRREVRTALRSNIAGRIKRRRPPSWRLLVAWARIAADHRLEVRRRSRRSHPASGGSAIGELRTDRVLGRFQPRSVPGPPASRPWGPTLVHVDVTDLVAPVSSAGWSDADVHAGRVAVGDLLQGRRDLDVVAVVRDPRWGVRIAGPIEHEMLLGAVGERALGEPATGERATGERGMGELTITRQSGDGPIVVDAEGAWTTDGGAVLVDLVQDGPPGSGLQAVVRTPDSDAVRLDLTTEGGGGVGRAIRPVVTDAGGIDPRPTPPQA